MMTGTQNKVEEVEKVKIYSTVSSLLILSSQFKSVNQR
jgi:hypothetical protein